MSDIKELREEYKSLYGKNPAPAWKEDKLQEMIDNFDSTSENTEDELKLDPNEEYEFELVGRKAEGKTYMIQQENKVYCEKTNTIRKVRLCPFEDSPYADEQREESKVTTKPLVFSYGKLKIKGTDSYKIKYLLALDFIEGKKEVLPENMSERNLFRMIDKSEQIKASLKEEEDKLNARILVSKSSSSELNNFMRSRFGSDTVLGKDESQIKTEAYKRADVIPNLFLTDFNNPKHKIKAQLQKALEKGDLKIGEGELFNKQGKSLYKFDAGRHAYDEAASRWILEGSKEAKELQSLLEDKS